MAKKNLTLQDIKMHHDPHAEPLTAGQQAAVANAKPRRRKPRYHREHQTVSASVSNDLARWLDALAARRTVTRSKLIAQILVEFRVDFADS